MHSGALAGSQAGSPAASQGKLMSMSISAQDYVFTTFAWTDDHRLANLDSSAMAKVPDIFMEWKQLQSLSHRQETMLYQYFVECNLLECDLLFSL